MGSAAVQATSTSETEDVRGTKKRALLIVTPFCSPNYSYPAPAYLARYLKRRGYEVHQADLSLEVLLAMFSRKGLERVFDAAEPARGWLDNWDQRVLSMRARYISTIEPVIRFLQGRDPSIAYRLCQPNFLPRGRHFEYILGFDRFDGNGSTVPVHDRGKFLATQYLYDIAELVRNAIFPYFQITLVDRHYDAYVHRVANFDEMHHELERAPNVIDEFLHETLQAHLQKAQPDLVGVTVPFARNLYWALRIGRYAKGWNPDVKVATGGGLFNTSMRKPREPRMFDYVDYMMLDDGEKPIECLLEHLEGRREASALKRTFYRQDGLILHSDGCKEPDAPHAEAGAPDYEGYRIADYFSSLETVNINQRVRSDGWWNKITMSHGCYWKKCSFCDIHLSYVGDYDTAPAKNLADKVEEIIAQTGHTGFHFVDEAMTPKIMRDFAIEVLRRDLHISWHGMMRFDKAFTPELCRLLAAAGLVAIMGGLEVASDRLLQLMKKGTSVDQVTRVAKNFKDAGIRVHAYIMYGFPTQTEQETVDALDVVRQLFKSGLLTSASWAKFGVTPHSPIGRDPEAYGIDLEPVPENAFIEQIINHTDRTGVNHDKFTPGLMEALGNYGLGLQTERRSETWFRFPVPEVSIDRDLIARILADHANTTRIDVSQKDRRMVWIGPLPTVRPLPGAYGNWVAELVLHDIRGDHTLVMPSTWAWWLRNMVERALPGSTDPITLKDLEEHWESAFRAAEAWAGGTPGPVVSFDQLLESELWATLRAQGLLLTETQNRVIWTGKPPTVQFLPEDALEGEPRAELILQPLEGRPVPLQIPVRVANWVVEVLHRSQPSAQEVDLAQLQASWAADVEGATAARHVTFRSFSHSPVWQAIRERGLAVL